MLPVEVTELKVFCTCLLNIWCTHFKLTAVFIFIFILMNTLEKRANSNFITAIPNKTTHFVGHTEFRIWEVKRGLSVMLWCASDASNTVLCYELYWRTVLILLPVGLMWNSFSWLWCALDRYGMSLFPAYSKGDSVPDKYNEQDIRKDGAGLLCFKGFYVTF